MIRSACLVFSYPSAKSSHGCSAIYFVDTLVECSVSMSLHHRTSHLAETCWTCVLPMSKRTFMQPSQICEMESAISVKSVWATVCFWLNQKDKHKGEKSEIRKHPIYLWTTPAWSTFSCFSALLPFPASQLLFCTGLHPGPLCGMDFCNTRSKKGVKKNNNEINQIKTTNIDIYVYIRNLGWVVLYCFFLLLFDPLYFSIFATTKTTNKPQLPRFFHMSFVSCFLFFLLVQM